MARVKWSLLVPIKISRCNIYAFEWASLPGSPYGQPTKSAAVLWNVYQDALKTTNILILISILLRCKEANHQIGALSFSIWSYVNYVPVPRNRFL